MLKQPLLSRMFKFRNADAAPVADEKLAVSGEDETAMLEGADAEVAGAEPSDVQDSVDVQASDTNAQKPVDVQASAIDIQKSVDVQASATNTAVLEKSVAVVLPTDTSAVSQTLDDSKTESAADSTTESVPDDTSTKATVTPADKRTKKRKLPKVTTTRVAIVLGGLAAVAGAVVPRVMSPTIRADISAKLARPAAPVSAANDPVVESLVTTGNLLVTNQILYRKLEAIAGVTLVNPADRVAPTLPAPAATTADTAVTDSKDSKSKDAAATAAVGNDKKDDSGTTGAKDAKPDPDVDVTAAAPPAPISDPVVFTGTTIDSVLEMRVAVAKDVSGIGFATSGNGVITDLDGNDLQSLSPETGVLAEDNGGLVVDGARMPDAFWVYPEDGGYVAVGDSWYRGRMLIARRERGLIAVNYVLLGDYLYSVVGTEVSPDWPIESLKAQAVAARSYALTHNIHPASEDYFDLDNTQRFQAYKGISREANTTQAAVQATAGEFISHDGGIVESLYAASQAIVDDAHSGSGMSQLGAKDLAEQGYSYQEILAHYYPGTALGRLETDKE